MRAKGIKIDVIVESKPLYELRDTLKECKRLAKKMGITKRQIKKIVNIAINRHEGSEAILKSLYSPTNKS